jgi:hypothetical protein
MQQKDENMQNTTSIGGTHPAAFSLNSARVRPMDSGEGQGLNQ